mmetsp:Transcript_6214/g.11114  ORF Transcript_6214/g.11114 Transcript_6214/m.11114 type:complete len:859 (-) Transcript_6214:504-3080(-)
MEMERGNRQVRVPVEELLEDGGSSDADLPTSPRKLPYIIPLAVLAIGCAAVAAYCIMPASTLETEREEAIAGVNAMGPPLPLQPPSVSELRKLGKSSRHVATASEEVADQFHPAVCAGTALQSAFTVAGLSIKVASAVRECTMANYEPYVPGADNTRRLDAKLPAGPGLPNDAELPAELPAPPKLLSRDALEGLAKSLGENEHNPGGTSYNVTEFDLSLENVNLPVRQSWTFEGWFYLYSSTGVLVDTREDIKSSSQKSRGMVAMLANGSHVLLASDGSSTGVARSNGKDAVPVNEWVHLAWQVSQGQVFFFTDGKLAGRAPAPEQLKQLSSVQRLMLAQGVEESKASKLHGFLTNVRFSKGSIYDPADDAKPKTVLELTPKTMFLLKDGYSDVVSGRRMHIRGWGSHNGYESRENKTGTPDLRFLASPNYFQLTHLSAAYGPDYYWAGSPDPVGTEPELPAWCGRTILTIIKDAMIIASNVEEQMELCPKEETEFYGMKCAKGVTRTIAHASNAGKYFAEFAVRGCDQRFDTGYAGCADRMEGAAWELDGLGTELNDVAVWCVPQEPDSAPATNIGACIGEIMSSMGYASSAGMYLGDGLDFKCPSAYHPQQRAELEQTGVQRRRNNWQKATTGCSYDSMAFVRTLFISASKAVRAGGSCGAKNTLCGQNVLLSAAAFAGIGQIASDLWKYCIPNQKCCEFDKTAKTVDCTSCGNSKDRQKIIATNVKNDGKCGRYSGSTAKLIGSSLAFAGEGAETCDDPNSARDACAAMIPFVIASFGYFAENAARNYYECPYYKSQDLYQCGQDQSKIGEAIEKASSSMAAAVINCGSLVGADGEVPITRLVGMVHPPRRFFIV